MVKPFVLASDRLRLEVPRTADIGAIYDACQDDTLQRFTTVPVPYTFQDAQFFVSQVVERGWTTGREYTWGLREPGSSLLVGMVSIRLMHHDVGFWAAPEARGRGLMTEAVRLVADWAFGDGGLDDVLWEGYVGNVASAGVARKAGFTYTGSGPGLQPDRDRGHPLCWKARLGRDDSRDEKPGWPAEATGSAPAP
ncbi:GNAT family N-acetyltransferase [Frondihabitans australicus]|uniref:RimJ/RimL family protein N-acetyltransferase n=1 Tax=Frondihabitans australicus TaxID=386892 RepID=A0A495IB00_9MICO|nr:GNAT family N-acetyltransferase [Frondihabitans australicus]RKR73177.1 RimJ/RimL family protein N-acetyltransferase [Frondihabitans australicus]